MFVKRLFLFFLKNFFGIALNDLREELNTVVRYGYFFAGIFVFEVFQKGEF